MITTECGTALILVYLQGTLISAISHAHDGGEAYMAPLLRRAIAFAKTQYSDADIVQILFTENEMQSEPISFDGLTLNRFSHVYYITVTVGDSGSKKYDLKSMHFKPNSPPTTVDVPTKAARIPKQAKRII